MPRTLTLARATVTGAAEPEYLRTVGQLARLSEPRGRRLWLFRSAASPETFLECSESRSMETHRVATRPPEDEQQLERRLRELASYAADRLELWEEVSL
jgi:hypothetical protein